MDEDFSNLYQFDQVARMPYVQPRYWPFAPMQALTWNPYITNAYAHMPFTTLDTFVAPRGQTKIDVGQGQSNVIPGTGYTVWGNAPYAGVYTGVPEE